MRVEHGSPLPLGALLHDGGVNFALFSRHAEKVELLLYDTPDASKHRLRIPLNPDVHRTGDIWHVWVGGVACRSGLRLSRGWPLPARVGHAL